MVINGVDTSQIQYTTSYVITDNKTSEILLRFDTIEEFEFSATATVTSYPTEKGIMVNDYKYLNADSFKVKGLIARRSNNQNQLELIKAQLKKYQSGMYGMNVQTKSGLYENYTLENYAISENVDNYGLLEVDMSFKQILTIGNGNNRESYDDDSVNGGVSYVQEATDSETTYLEANRV